MVGHHWLGTLELAPNAQVGALIALNERAVGFYASLVNINAYHQPGVEPGKNAATRLLEADPEDVCHLLRHIAANDLTVRAGSGARPSTEIFFVT